MTTSLFETLCDAMWEARMETHDRWPDEGPFAKQNEMVKDWVRDEVRGVLEALRDIPNAITDDKAFLKGHRTLIDTILAEAPPCTYSKR